MGAWPGQRRGPEHGTWQRRIYGGQRGDDASAAAARCGVGAMNLLADACHTDAAGDGRWLRTLICALLRCSHYTGITQLTECRSQSG